MRGTEGRSSPVMRWGMLKMGLSPFGVRGLAFMYVERSCRQPTLGKQVCPWAWMEEIIEGGLLGAVLQQQPQQILKGDLVVPSQHTP